MGDTQLKWNIFTVELIKWHICLTYSEWFVCGPFPFHWLGSLLGTDSFLCRIIFVWFHPPKKELTVHVVWFMRLFILEGCCYPIQDLMKEGLRVLDQEEFWKSVSVSIHTIFWPNKTPIFPRWESHFQKLCFHILISGAIMVKMNIGIYESTELHWKNCKCWNMWKNHQ